MVNKTLLDRLSRSNGDLSRIELVNSGVRSKKYFMVDCAEFIVISCKKKTKS